jgi:cytochrome c2
MAVFMRWRAPSLAVLGIVLAAAVTLGGAGVHYLRDQQKKSDRAARMTGGDPDKAQGAIKQYGCAACHEIPGSQSPGGRAGPALSGMADRLYIGGAVPNTPENLISWIVNPKELDPKTAMPRTGIDRNQARDVAAYLYGLR